MDNFVREAHKLKSHKKPGYTKSLPRPALRPVPRQARRGVFTSVDTAGREASRGEAGLIEIYGAWDDLLDGFVPCVGRRYQIRPVRLFRTFRPIRGHFRPVSGHSPTMSEIARSHAPFRPACRYLVPLSRAVGLKKNRPAHRLGWAGRPRRERRSAVTVIERQEDGFWKKTFSNKSVAVK